MVKKNRMTFFDADALIDLIAYFILFKKLKLCVNVHFSKMPYKGKLKKYFGHI